LPTRLGRRRSASCADHQVTRGNNALQLGIAAVSARLADGTLRVVEGACPNLLAEACLYRYPEDVEARGENPLDEHNHALAALRYLISRLDARRMARRTQGCVPTPGKETEEGEVAKVAEMSKQRQLQHLWMHPGCWTSWGS